jgi:acyl-CoA thioester hydrolase
VTRQPAPHHPDGVPTVHETRIPVRRDDVDHLGHVNNLVYVRWVQDVAAAHWRSATTDEQRSRIEWVVVRHEIDYKAPAFEGDEVVARTWVEAWTAVTSDRHTEIRRASDGTVLARARTVWCAVDPETLKPRRVDRSMLVAFRRPA